MSSSIIDNNCHSMIVGGALIACRNQCAFCGITQCNATSVTLLHCAACHMVVYCCKEHQNNDWKRHKPICKIIQQQQLTEKTTTMISSSVPSSSSSINDDVQIIDSFDRTTTSISQRSPRKRTNDTFIKSYCDHSKNRIFKTTVQEHLRLMAASGHPLNQYQAIQLRLKHIAEHVIESLNDYGWAVVDNFLGVTHCRSILQEVERLYRCGGLFAAGELMEKRNDGSTSSEIRSDHICWFESGDDRSIDAVTVRLLVSMIDSVIVYFKDRIPPYTISGRSRAMIACYPGNGTRYVKHVDNPVKDGRCITSIYYCNENWILTEHGGALRLYPETSATSMDIDPQGDRLIFFWSDRQNPHEVQPVYRNRYAITIWYFDHQEKMAAIERRKAAESRVEVVIDDSQITSEREEDPPPANDHDRPQCTSLPDMTRAYRDVHINRVFANYPPPDDDDDDSTT